MFQSNIKIKDVKLEIGQLVRATRKRERISQKALAEQLDLSRLTIQNIESGKNFTIDTLLKILQYFDLLSAINKMLVDRREEQENVKSLY